MSNSLRNLINSTVFMAIVACVLWSTAFAGVKIGLQYMSPLQFAGLRFFIAGLLIFVFYRKYHQYFKALKEHLRYVLLIAFLQTVLMYSLFYTGLNMVPGSLGAMVIGSGPLFAAIVAHFGLKNDKMNARTISSFFLGIAGIVIINLGRQTQGIAGFSEIIGVLLLIVNNMISGLYNVVIVRSKRNISMMVLSSASLWIGGLLLFLISIPFEGFQLNTIFPLEFWISLGWLSFLSAAAFALWFTLLRRPGVKISYLNSWKFIVPVLGAVLSWILLPGESPDVYALIGMVVVAAAMLVMNHEAIMVSFRKKK